eukprot:SAG22_NODE_363_length_11694_cov_40.815783_8_plen_147_part_00
MQGAPLPEAAGLPAGAGDSAPTRPGEVDLSGIAALEPRPVVARRGQALVFTQSLVHAGWHNADTEPRKAVYCTFVAAEHASAVGGLATEGGGGGGGVDEIRTIHPRIRRLLPPGRKHIVMTPEALEAALAAYREQWPPTLRHRFRL